MASKKVGAVCYFEVPSKNLPAAKRFYGRAFGWKVVDSDLEGAPYAFFEAPGMTGGLDPRMKSSRDGVLLYIKTKGIPAKLKEVVKAGGSVIAGRRAVSEERKEFGYFGLFRDPNGNKLGLWSAKP